MLSICPLRIRWLKSENWTLVSGPGSSASNAGGMIPVLGPLDGDMAAMNNITILQYTSTPLCVYTTGFQKCFKYCSVISISGNRKIKLSHLVVIWSSPKHLVDVCRNPWGHDLMGSGIKRPFDSIGDLSQQLDLLQDWLHSKCTNG